MNASKLLRFLRANALAVFLAVVPPLGLWYYAQRETRAVTVTVTADVPIVTVEPEFASGVEVRYRGTSVATVRAVEIAVKNAGNRSLSRGDVDSPLTFGIAGQLLGAPGVVHRIPEQLPVQLQPSSGDSLRLAPLLLNPRDEFTFRVLVANAPPGPARVVVTGRLVGVADVRVGREIVSSGQRRAPAEWLTLFSTVIAVVTTVAGVAQVARSGARTLEVRAGVRRAVLLGQEIELDARKTSRAAALARELGIAQHDVKSNLLLLRLRIESQLRELARAYGLPDHDQAGGMSRIARALARRGVLESETAKLIDALARPINRELHELDSSLTDAEFDAVQRAALDVVARLPAIPHVAVPDIAVAR